MFQFMNEQESEMYSKILSENFPDLYPVEWLKQVSEVRLKRPD